MSARQLRSRLDRLALSAGIAVEQDRDGARPTGYGPRQALNDSNRLHQLHCKRLTPPSCGGGTLTDAEDAEEAQLAARVAAYRESPEGRARNRIFELQLRAFGSEFSAAQRNELDSLRTLYPTRHSIRTIRSRRHWRLLQRASVTLQAFESCCIS